MIRSLIVTNFQSYVHSTLNFCPGVNVITGTSNHGKSALLRASRWVTFNRPAGDSFRSWWGGETRVEMVLGNPTFALQRIQRIKGKGINSYLLGEEEFKAFGQEVPAEIQSALALDELNWQRQHDMVFLLAENDPEIARQLNRIAKLEVIDIVASNIRGMMQEASRKVNELEERESHLASELEAFANLDKQEELLESLEAKEKQRDELDDAHATLGNLLESGRQITLKVRESGAIRVQTLLPTLNHYMGKLKQRDTLREEEQALANLLSDIDKSEAQQRQLTQEQKQLDTELHKTMPKACPLCGRPF